MTQYEQYVFNQRKEDFFHKVYTGENFGRIDMKECAYYIRLSFGSKSKFFRLFGEEIMVLEVNDNIDYLAFLYASDRYDDIKEILKTKFKEHLEEAGLKNIQIEDRLRTTFFGIFDKFGNYSKEAKEEFQFQELFNGGTHCYFEPERE